MTSASHVERDEKAGMTYDFTMDLTARLKGTYNVFCIPDSVHEEPYLLAKVQDEPCYIHRYILDFLFVTTMWMSLCCCHCDVNVFVLCVIVM